MSGEQPCISINTSNVVLNGAAHTLLERQAYSKSIGIGTMTEPQTNVTIRNLTVNGPHESIAYRNVSESRLVDVTTLNAGKNSILLRGNNVTVAQSTVESGSIRPHGAYITIRDNTFRHVRAILARDPGSNSNLTIANNQLEDSEISLSNAPSARVIGNYGGRRSSVIGGFVPNIVIRDNEVHEIMIRYVDLMAEKPFHRPRNVTITDNTVSGDPSVRLMNVRNATVANNSISFTDNTVSGDSIVQLKNVHNATVANNSIVRNATVANNSSSNRISGVELDDNMGVITIDHNTITGTNQAISNWGSHGLIRIRANRLQNNNVAIYGNVDQTEVNGTDMPSVTVLIHRNVFTNDHQAVRNPGSGILNATLNYWGASTGPSSTNSQNAPFRDPVTGALANGSGASVSQKPDTVGISNVHFDHWLRQAPSDAGVTNSTAT